MESRDDSELNGQTARESGKTPSASDFTEYGWLDGLRDINILTVCLDTWYYDEDFGQHGKLGIMDLGPGPNPAQDGAVAFVLHQLDVFAAAFTGLVHLRPSLFIDISQDPKGIQHPHLYIEAGSMEDLRRRVAELSPKPLVNTQVRFDMTPKVRDFAGALRETDIFNVGYLDIYLGSSGTVVRASAHPPVPSWRALLVTGMLPLFMYDNRPMLATVRERWRDLRATYPNKTWDDAEESQVSGMITLAAPPGGLSDNEQLAQINRARLFSAVANWESALGRAFTWLAPFDQAAQTK